MQAYKDLITEILTRGVPQLNTRTGIVCTTMPGGVFRHDMATGFPVVTGRKMAFRPTIGELIGFLRGTSSAKDFRDLGCKFWDGNANQTPAWLASPFRKGEDDLGPIHGVQWRRWPAYKQVPWSKLGTGNEGMEEHLEKNGWNTLEDTAYGQILYKEIDQVEEVVRKLVTNPSDRRILFSGWNPAVLDEVCLPSCHMTYQFLPNLRDRELNLCLYMRSCDVYLGAPSNIVLAATLLHLMGRLTGFTPRHLTICIGDAHLYSTHEEAYTQYMALPTYPLPELSITPHVPDYQQIREYADRWGRSDDEEVITCVVRAIDALQSFDFDLVKYVHGPVITAPMAV